MMERDTRTPSQVNTTSRCKVSWSKAPNGPRRPNNFSNSKPVATGGITSGNEMIVENQADAKFQPGDRFELDHDGRKDMLKVVSPAYIEKNPDGSLNRWHIPITRTDQVSNP